MFRPRGGDDTKLRRDETVFRPWRRHPETGAGYQSSINEGPQRPMTGTVMIKALSAVALGAFVGAGITVLLGFVPEVEASVTAPLGKSDRLEIQEVGGDCSDDRIWPNPCLRELGYEILKDQLVTAERARQGRAG
jgi:hypothetical protein